MLHWLHAVTLNNKTVHFRNTSFRMFIMKQNEQQQRIQHVISRYFTYFRCTLHIRTLRIGNLMVQLSAPEYMGQLIGETAAVNAEATAWHRGVNEIDLEMLWYDQARTLLLTGVSLQITQSIHINWRKRYRVEIQWNWVLRKLQLVVHQLMM